jgi:hypothetical protein
MHAVEMILPKKHQMKLSSWTILETVLFIFSMGSGPGYQLM